MTSLTELGALGGVPTANENRANALSGSQDLVSSTQFLELLVAQMQNQNPFEPLEGTQFVTQLAQFASLEQLTGVNEGLDSVNRGQAGLLNQQSVQMLGRKVTFPGREVVLPEDGSVGLKYRLNAAAPDLTISVFDEFGVKRGEISGGPRAAGFNDFEWDGTVMQGGEEVALPPGTYAFEVAATDGTEDIPAQTFGSGRVTGITYENGQPELMLGEKRILPGQVLEIVD
jgi:flagellar basal-body rod modification protein FlgD